MSLKTLINDQLIIIDDHKRGTGEVKDFDASENDVHIDKETNFPIDGRRQKLKIRIPINSEAPIKVENKRKQIPIPIKLNKEIKRAFENKQVRNAFIRDVLETLTNYQSALNSEEKAIKILERLSKHFDLKWDDEIIKKYREEALLTYTQFYTDENNRRFFIKLDKNKITIGENNGYAKQFKDFNPK
jgi:metal-responsive CopG/Arc/MetJ family transcriptional regulator